MTTYYAVCNVGGPISVNLEAETEAEALAAFGKLDKRAAIDDCCTDAEDELDIDGDGMSEDEFAEQLKLSGATPERDLDAIVNYQAGTVAHLSDGWYLWSVETVSYTYTI